jgi:hypothetical protein
MAAGHLAGSGQDAFFVWGGPDFHLKPDTLMHAVSAACIRSNRTRHVLRGERIIGAYPAGAIRSAANLSPKSEAISVSPGLFGQSPFSWGYGESLIIHSNKEENG